MESCYYHSLLIAVLVTEFDGPYNMAYVHAFCVQAMLRFCYILDFEVVCLGHVYAFTSLLDHLLSKSSLISEFSFRNSTLSSIRGPTRLRLSLVVR